MIPQFKLKINKSTLFFYIVHVFGLITALILILLAFITGQVEKNTVGDFELRVTPTIVTVFYIAGAFLVCTVVIGFLAQRLPDKPSLWIVYCILLSISSLICLIMSVDAGSRSSSNSFTGQQLKVLMDYYVVNTKNATKWDNLHKKYKCCGVTSYKDWQDVQFGRTSLRVPQTCCRPSRIDDDYCGLNILPHDDNADELIYAQGCLEPAMKDLNTLLAILGIVGLSVSVIHMVLAALSCYLVITKKV